MAEYDASTLLVDRNLALELVRVTEAAALAASRWIGRGDKNAADGAAVDAMRKAFDTVAISGTVVLAERGGFLHAPDIYMDKIAVGPGLPEGIVHLDAKPEENLRELARAKKCDIGDLMVCTLDRDRHKDMIAACRKAGARIMLLGDGDVAGVIAVSQA